MVRGTFQCWGSANDLIGHDDIEGCGAGGGVQALALAWDSQYEWLDANQGSELQIHLLFNRRIPAKAQAPFVSAAPTAVELWSSLPHEGRVLLRPHEPIDRIALRIPDGSSLSSVTVRRTRVGSQSDKRTTTQEGQVETSGRYVILKHARPGEDIELLFPLESRITTEYAAGKPYRVTWNSSTVIALDPPGKRVPLYQNRSVARPRSVLPTPNLLAGSDEICRPCSSFNSFNPSVAAVSLCEPRNPCLWRRHDPQWPPMTDSPVPGDGSKIRVSVLGVGSLGKEHARIYAELAAAGLVDFVGIYDPARESARLCAEKHRVQAFDSVEQAMGNSEALSVVTPTQFHFEITKKLLQNGKHVLVEKPMTDNAEQATQLVELAQATSCILQVGHVERFNPVFKYLETVATEPRFIETHRLSPFPARSTDIGVVLDLMIHDLDIVLAFVKAPVTSVDAVGIPVLSRSEDIANARLRFANSCVANLTVSRVSAERMRKIRVFSGGATTSYISLDYRAQEGFIYRIAREGEAESSLFKKLLQAKTSTIVSQFGGKKIVREPVPLAKEEPLRLELQHFIGCVQAQQTPLVSGESARRALELALEITRQVQSASSGVKLD